MIREPVGFFVPLDALFRYPLPAVIYYRGSAPVRRVPFFACPKQGTQRKGTPDSAPRMYTPHAGFPRSAGGGYRVRRGDTLWSIARTYRVYVKQLARWNAIGPRDTLRIGTKLRIW